MRRGKGYDAVVVSIYLEQLRECTLREETPDLVGVANLVEEMGVDVERRAHLRVPENAADLSDIQAQVDDQVARERVPEIVKAQAGPGSVIEPGQRGGAVQSPGLDVAVPERGPRAGVEYPYLLTHRGHLASVFAKS